MSLVNLCRTAARQLCRRHAAAILAPCTQMMSHSSVSDSDVRNVRELQRQLVQIKRKHGLKPEDDVEQDDDASEEWDAAKEFWQEQQQQKEAKLEEVRAATHDNWRNEVSQRRSESTVKRARQSREYRNSRTVESDNAYSAQHSKGARLETTQLTEEEENLMRNSGEFDSRGDMEATYDPTTRRRIMRGYKKSRDDDA